MPDLSQKPEVNEVSSSAMYLQAAKDLPIAFADIFSDAAQHPVDAALHVTKELATSAAFGAALGYILPAKGPAAAITAIGFAIPSIYSGYKRLNGASNELHAGVSQDIVAQSLARDTVSGSGNLLLNLAGGYYGTEGGAWLAKSENFGGPARSLHSKIAVGENEGLIAVRNSYSAIKTGWQNMSKLKEDGPYTGLRSGIRFGYPEGTKPGDTSSSNATAELKTAASPQGLFGGVKVGAPVTGEAVAPRATVAEQLSPLSQRLKQYSLVSKDVADGPPEALQMVFGSVHGHSHFSDGLGAPEDLFNKAIQEGQDVTGITDHNHDLARAGISPGDPRMKDEQGIPIISSAPDEYAITQAAAAKTTIPGKHVSIVGIEVGTIGSEPHGHGGGGGPSDSGAGGSGTGPTEDATHSRAEHHDVVAQSAEVASATQIKPSAAGDQSGVTVSYGPHDYDPKTFLPLNFKAAQEESLSAEHLGGPSGVNHINVLEVPFFASVKQPAPQPGAVASISEGLGSKAVPEVAPGVLTFNDGDYKSIAVHLSQTKDSTGNTPIVTLNHPRFLDDKSPTLPPELQNRDYGRKSFDNDDQWRSQFVLPFVRGIELIKGGALNPNPVNEVPAGMVDLQSYIGYLGLGVEAGPLFGRDFHFGNPVGNPGSTGFLVSALDKPEVLDSLRQRRTIATTSKQRLSGYMVANDKFYMGSIIDQSAVPQLALKMKIAGQIDPAAQYNLRLFGDDQVLDGKDASVIQSKQVSGQDLLNANSEVQFDPITHTQGNNSLYFVEVARTQPGATSDGQPNTGSGGASDVQPDKMWTSPVWVRPLVGDSHGLMTRLSVGSATQWPTVRQYVFPKV